MNENIQYNMDSISFGDTEYRQLSTTFLKTPEDKVF